MPNHCDSTMPPNQVFRPNDLIPVSVIAPGRSPSFPAGIPHSILKKRYMIQISPRLIHDMGHFFAKQKSEKYQCPSSDSLSRKLKASCFNCSP